MMNNFVELSINEMEHTNGGGIILCGLAIAGGATLIFGGTFAVGYGLARWLG